MKKEQLWVLLVEDEWSLREPLAKRLRDAYGYHVDVAADAAGAWRLVTEASRRYDVALIDDLLTPDSKAEPEPIGVELMEQIRKRCPETECIVFTGWGMDRAMVALQAGAYRYLEKPVKLTELGITIRLAVEQAQLRRERDLLSTTLEISNAMVGGLDMVQMLEVIAEAVPKLVGAEACAVAWEDPVTGRVQYEPKILTGDAAVRWQRHMKDVLLTRQIIETGQPFALSDVDAHADAVDENLCRAGVKSFVGIPISGDPHNQGVLYAYSTRREAFGIYEQCVLELLANQAAIALENARLFSETNRRARSLETLQNLALTVNSSLDLDETLKAACRAAVELSNADHSGLVLFDSNYAQGDVRAEYPALDTLGTIIPLRGVPAEEKLIETKKPLVIPDVINDESLGAIRAILLESDIQSILIVPVVGKSGELLGSFSLDAVGHRRQFTAEEVGLCRVFAAHVAVAVGNARLFSKLSEAKEWREALVENAFDAVIAIDQNGKITVFNQRAEEMFGWKAGEIVGQTVKLLHMDVGRAREILKAVNGEEAITGWDVELKHRDGTRIPALLSAALIRDSRGRPIGQAGFLRDVRQVSLLEDRLRALIRVGQAITGTLELDKVLDLVVKSAVAAFPVAQSGTIHLHDQRADILRVQAGTRIYSADTIKTLSLRAGEGIAGWVFQNQQPLVVDDAQRDPRYKRIDHPEVQSHRSMICVPLRVKEQVIGTLSLSNNDVTGAFQSEDLGLLSTFADQTAIAIDNARRVQELEQMRQAAETMASAFEPQQALQQIVESAAQVLQADSTVIWSYDDVRDQFIPEELVAVDIPRDELERFRVEPKPGRTADTVMREGYVAVTDILQVKCNFLGQPTRKLLGRIGVRSFQGIALQAGDERLGVLYANYNRPRVFGRDEEATLRTFANHASLALENARLMVQMQRTREAAGVIAGVTVQEDLGQTLEAIAQHTQRVLHSDAVTLYSYDEATGQFGEWAAEISDPRSQDAASPPEEFDPDSAVGTILKLGGPKYYHLAEDHAQCDHLLAGDFVKAEGIKAAIGVQLRVGIRKVGVMFVNFRSPHRFTSDEVATIQLFADQAAVAIRNAQLYQVEQRHGQALKAIQATSAAVNAVLDLDVLLPMITDEAAGIFTAPATSLMLWDESKENLVIRAAFGLGDEYRQKQRVARRKVDELLEKKGLGPHIFDIDSKPIGKPELVKKERLYTTLVAPLAIGSELTGVLNIYSRDEPRQFEENEVELAAIFANHATIAIQNAQLYRQATERLEESMVLQKIALSLASTLELEELLDLVMAAAMSLTSTDSGSVLLWDSRIERFTLTLSTTGPSRKLQPYRSSVRQEGGITRAIIDRRKPIVITDTLRDPRVSPATIEKGRRALVGVPLLSREEVIGVLFVKRSEPREFPDRQVRLLEAFASQAAVAIEKARRHKELLEMHKQLAAKSALAWMGMAGSTWAHSVTTKAVIIKENAQALRGLVAVAGPPEKIEEKLKRIEDQANEIQKMPITVPLSAEEGVRLVGVNALLRERIPRVCKQHGEDVQIKWCLMSPDVATVKTSPEWLRRALDILVDNAIEAIIECPVKVLTVSSEVKGGTVEISIADTGRGIPEQDRAKLFREPVPSEKGTGMGLLLALTIVEAYGGDIRLEATGPLGTTMIISLPLGQSGPGPAQSG